MSSDSPAPDIVKVFLFKDSYAPFVELLEESGIEFTVRTPPVGAIRNSGTEIEILGIVVPALAGIIIRYLKGKASREIHITTRSGDVIRAKGYDVEELGLRDVLASAKNLNVIDTAHKAVERSPREE